MHEHIDETAIRTLVSRFYAAVRRHPDLGLVFAKYVDDWAEHEDRLCDFWSSVLLASGRYKGNPAQIHAALPELTRAHFVAWLGLFAAVVREVFAEAAAEEIMGRAHRMARHLQSRLPADPTDSGTQTPMTPPLPLPPG